jgi:hypothetical protein
MGEPKIVLATSLLIPRGISCAAHLRPGAVSRTRLFDCAPATLPYRRFAQNDPLVSCRVCAQAEFPFIEGLAFSAW